MYTLKENHENTIIINKSKFICSLIKIENLKDIERNINTIKLKYKDATHYCYAYIINENKKSFDDGEPSGTAGSPILNILEKNNLNYVLCVVTRYFGGTKLGAGGLIRAYSKSANECLKTAKKFSLVEGVICDISFNYNENKFVNSYITEKEIISSNFDNQITYKIKISKEKYSRIKGIFDNHNIEINNVINTYIES